MAKYFLAIMICLSLISAVPSASGAETVLIDRFNGDMADATLEFNNSFTNSTLSIDIPPGVILTRAEMVVEGVGMPGSPSSVLDFLNGVEGSNVFAHWNEGQGLYPPTVDPRTHRWNKIANNELSLIQKDDGNLWATQTTGQALPPYEYPIQLYRFIPISVGATSMKVMWHGAGQNALNLTTPFWADLWLYNHTDAEWTQVANYTSDASNTTWINYTFEMPSPFIASDGSVDVAVAGPHSESNLLMNPGLLSTDYIALEVTSLGEIQYPMDVMLSIDGVDIVVLVDNVTSPRMIDDAQGFKEGLQQVLDAYPVRPDNVTLTFDFSVQLPTAGRLTVRDLIIWYEPIENMAPVYIGPVGVSLDEDSPWTSVLDLDAAFMDDYNSMELEFELMEVEWPDIPLALFRLRTADGGNRTLEVKPAPDFFGDIPFVYSIKATDLFDLETIGHLNITILQKPDQPSLEEIVYLEAYERTPFSYFVNVIDPDLPDDNLVFADDSELLDIDPETGEIVWTPSADQIGEHTFRVTVTDRFGLYDRNQYTITVINSNDPPVITSSLKMDGKQGEETSYALRADDPDVPFGDVLQYFAFADALAFDIDQDTGRITFTPANDQVPSFEIIIRVQDKIGELDEEILVVTVENVNDPPVFAEYGELSYNQGEQVEIQLEVSDPDLEVELPVPEVLTFSGTGPAMLLPDSGGHISFGPDQSMVGSHEVTYTVTDRAGVPDVVTVTWMILNVNDAPLISTELPDEVLEDSPFSVTLEATDLDGDDVTWSVDTTIFDIDPATGLVEFTPTQEHVGEQLITFTASDGRGGDAMMAWDFMVINVNDVPMISAVEPENGKSFEEGKSIPLSAQAADEDGDALTYTWKRGDKVLGTGATIDVDDLAPGKYTITLTVDDGNNGQATHDIKLEVTSTGMSSSTLIMALLVVVIVVIVATVMYVRSRSRAPVPSEDVAEDIEDEEDVDKMEVTYESIGVLEYDTEGVAIRSEGTTESIEEPIYSLEDAEEYKPE